MSEITDIEVTPIAVPVASEASGSSYTKAQRGTMVVTVRTSDGVIGRTYSGDVTDSSPEKAKRLVKFIEDEIRPRVVGRPLLSLEAIWEDLFVRSSQFFVYQPEDRLLYIHALGAVDIALWDAVGKTLDTPLYKLWGGYRDSLPIIAIGGYYEDGKTRTDLVDEMEEYRQMGLAGVKLKVGGRSVSEDLERLAAVRDAMGEEFIIACDANQGYSIEEAVEFGSAAREYDIEWFEEPVVWYDQYDGMREVRRRANVPVTAGQSESTATACRRLIEAEAVDVINLDASIAGGPTAWRKVAATADLHNVEMAHHEEPHVSMHLLSSIPNGRYAECFHPDVDPVWHRLVTNLPRIADGLLHLPDGPGLGIELDEGFIEEFTVHEFQ
ncbi:mandelate racemase/muconate lactonizing enzyme family protein [Halomarina halobia]|uniref:Mandelate racemase/muconate lactonizing enzyme family protein n=1 Tax=Halomarina halobia TaxID=3033386 RepID=A0ABD6AEW3_9EURY|nr:mandelate racemase/muconate lactonizing enzyme family protein [Halomarina sp. PSR21]